MDFAVIVAEPLQIWMNLAGLVTFPKNTPESAKKQAGMLFCLDFFCLTV